MSKRTLYAFIIFYMSLTMLMTYPTGSLPGDLPRLIRGFLYFITFGSLTAVILLYNRDRPKTVPKDDSSCPHKNWGPVLDGYQYCDKCGKACAVSQAPCVQHKDEIISEIEIRNKNQGMADRVQDINSVSGIIYINRCENCGRIQKVQVKIIEDNG